MVRNSYCICKICKCKLRLRYQVGAFNIPINIYCPKCQTHIFGEINIDNDAPRINEKINNVLANNENEDYEYVFELSTEFLVKKCTAKENFPTFELTMFMRSDPFNSEKFSIINGLEQLLNNKDDFNEKIENISNLINNKKTDLFINYLKSLDNPTINKLKKQFNFNNIKSYLDCLCISKYYFNSSMKNLMTKNTFNLMNDVMKSIMPNIIKKQPNNFKKFLKFLNDNNYFNNYTQRIPRYIVQYCKIAKQLIPLYGVYNNFDKVDLNTEGVSTLNIEEMATVYKNGYEILCDSIDALAGLYNIDRYGFYNIFDGKHEDFISYVNKKYNSKYLKYEHFSSTNSVIYKGISQKLNNIIRNSEGHNTFEINGKTQNVKFINNHRGKKKEISIFFIEFGKQCIDLFNSILIIYEYYYQLYKYRCILLDFESINIIN